MPETEQAWAFARIKALFSELADLPRLERDARLGVLAASETPEVLDALRGLLEHTSVERERMVSPLDELADRLLSEQLSSGDVLGAWTLLEEIGAGGMGRVFRARRSDGHFDQEAAVKLLATEGSPRALAYLARERQILATLAHPSIARLLDGGSTECGQPYFVMEYVDGLPIHRYCEQHRLGLSDRLELMIETCQAVSYAHRRLVIHCDLKPTNVLVTRDRRPILLDFGVSRHLMAAERDGVGDEPVTESSVTATSRAYTPRYASPEQVSGERLGTATDIYSLGLMLAELVDGRLDDDGGLRLEGLPADLAAIIRKATEPSPEQRYASAEALAADLRSYREHRPVQARAATAGYRTRRWLRRQWPWAAVGAAFLALTVTFSLRMRSERDAALAAESAARAVISFMVSVFQGADPEVSGQRDLPVSALLDAGRERLDSELATQPLVQAELAGILGGVYQTLGEREAAQALFDRALRSAGATAPPLLRAELLHRKAYTTYDQEDFAAAEPLAREALALRRAHAPASIDLVATLRLLGLVRSYQNEPVEARALLDEALSLASRIAGPDSVEAGRAHLALARFHYYHDFTGAATTAQARAALAIFERAFGPAHHSYVNALEFVALGLAADYRLDEAVPLAQEVAEQRIALYGELSYQAGYGLYSYADLLDASGRRREALPLAERCLAIQQSLDGEDAVSSVPPRLLLAAIQEGLGLYEEAVASYTALADIRATQGETDARSAALERFYLGRALRLAGDLDRARAHTEPVLRGYADDPDTPPYYLLRSQLEMATLLRSQGRLAEAEAMLAAIDRSVFDPMPWRLADIEIEVAKLAAARGQDDALAMFVAAEARIADGLGEDHPDTWIFRLDRAEYLAAQGDRAAARELAEAIRRGARDTIDPNGTHAARLARLTATVLRPRPETAPEPS